MVVEEHAAHDLGQDLLGRTGDAGIVEQMALAVLGGGEERVGQPSDKGLLGESALTLKQFHAAEQSSELILPATSGSEQLFEHKRAASQLVLIPSQHAEIVQCAQHGGSKDAAGAHTTACRNGREERQLDAAAEIVELLLERSVALVTKLRQESGKRQRGLGDGER